MALFKYFKLAVVIKGTLLDPHGPLPSKVQLYLSPPLSRWTGRCWRLLKRKGEGSTTNSLLKTKRLSASMLANTVWLKRWNISRKKASKKLMWEWKKGYEKELKEQCKCAALEMFEWKICHAIKRGRPPLLHVHVGEKLDTYLQELIVEMGSWGTPIVSTIAAPVACGILLKHNKALLEEFGGPVNLNHHWAKQVLREECNFRKEEPNQKLYHLILIA